MIIVEPRARVGNGVAYSTAHPMHRLNAPAGEMSAYEQQPDHFVRWSRRVGAALDAESFADRALFGQYFRDVLADAQERAGPRCGLEHVRDQVVAAIYRPRASASLLVGLADGGHLEADTLILALGPPPTRAPWADDEGLVADQRMIVDPWIPRRLGAATPGRVLLVGTGLTMVDIALQLATTPDSEVRLHARSRHGLLPLRYGQPARRRWGGRLELPGTARELVSTVRVAAAKARLDGADWRNVLAGLRGEAPDLWSALSPEERRRLLRHAGRFYEVHRHRLAPEVASSFSALVTSGTIEIGRGRLQNVEATPTVVRAELRGPRGVEILDVDAVVNCTGPSAGYGGVPVVDRLVESGLARHDEVGLGLDTDSEGALRTGRGDVLGCMYAVGWLRRGGLYESTAIPEIRRQASKLVGSLVRR